MDSSSSSSPSPQVSPSTEEVLESLDTSSPKIHHPNEEVLESLDTSSPQMSPSTEEVLESLDTSSPKMPHPTEDFVEQLDTSSSKTPHPTEEVVDAFNTFTLFPKLPAEVRLMIWSYKHEPRIIEVFLESDALHRYYQQHPHATGNKDGDVKRPVAAVTRNPVMLSINQETRAEALKHYQLVNLAEWYTNLSRHIYVDFSIDTIFVTGTMWRHDTHAKFGMREDFPNNKIQHLLVCEGMHECGWLGPMRKWSRLFPTLTNLTILTDRTDSDGLPIEQAWKHITDELEEWYKLKHEDRFVDAVNIKDLTSEEIERRGLQPVVYALDNLNTESSWPAVQVQVVYRNLACEFNERWVGLS